MSGKALEADKSRDEPAASALPLTFIKRGLKSGDFSYVDEVLSSGREEARVGFEPTITRF